MSEEYKTQATLPCAICIIDNDIDYSILYANELFYSLIGYTAEDVLYKYKNHMSIFFGDDISKQIRQSIQNNEDVFEVEHSIKHSFYNEKWVRLQIDLSNIKTNNTITVILVDLSQHKLIEESLKRYQEKTLDIFNFAHFDAYEYDGNTFELRHVYAQYLFKEAPPMNSIFPNFYFDNHIIHPNCREKCSLVADNLKSGKKTKEQCDVQIKCENGEYKWVRSYFEMKKTGDDISLIQLFFDITSEKEATLRYLHETMYYQAMLSDQDAFGHVDVTDDFILKVGGLWNGYNEIIKHTHFSEIFDEFKMKVVHPDDREQYTEVMSIRNLLTSYANGIIHLGFDFRRIVEKNKMAWVNLSIHLFKNPIDNHIMALMYIKNIQSHKKNEYNPLLKSIEFDALTSLYNRESAEKLIVQYLKDMKPSEVCTLVLIDIDDFVKFNHRYGDEITNYSLVKISELLNRIFRKSDIIARYSQDQFIMLLKNYDCNVNLKLRLDHFMKLVSQQNNPPISLSMGVAIVDSGMSYDRCFRHADIALFAAKHSGKSCYVFYHDQILNEEARLLLEQRRKGFSAQEEINLSTNALMDRDTEIIEEFNMLSGEEGDIAYLINPENYDLICGNQAFYNRIGKTPDDCRAKKCYELMHHRSSPCPFCRKSNWSEERFYLYKNHNDVLNKDFLIKNKLVQWKNKQMVLAYAIDLSDDRSISGLIENDVLESNYILNGIHVMQDAENLDESIYNGLDTIGHFFKADNVRMWYMGNENSRFICNCNWIANAYKSDLYKINEHDVESINFWLKEKKWEESIVVESLEAMLCHSYDLYQIMNKSQTTNQRWIELINTKKHKAFIEINNVQTNYQNVTFMESFKSFMLEDWNKRDIVDGVIYANYHDSLTKLYNRNQYDLVMEKYNADNYHSIAAVCININGLSRINKASGDNTGDYFII
ncbi:MAG: diguanylate cyclase, partial [Coprobacillus sp.]